MNILNASHVLPGLPAEMWVSIASHLGLFSRIILSRVNKYLHRITTPIPTSCIIVEKLDNGRTRIMPNKYVSIPLYDGTFCYDSNIAYGVWCEIHFFHKSIFVMINGLIHRQYELHPIYDFIYRGKDLIMFISGKYLIATSGKSVKKYIIREFI